MSEVWIYHPGLDRYSQVPESAVGQHAMSGWVQQDPPQTSDEGADESVAEAEPTDGAASKKTVSKKTTASQPASDEE